MKTMLLYPPSHRICYYYTEYKCHVYVRSDKLACVVIGDMTYPQRVCFTLMNKVCTILMGVVVKEWLSTNLCTVLWFLYNTTRKYMLDFSHLVCLWLDLLLAGLLYLCYVQLILHYTPPELSTLVLKYCRMYNYTWNVACTVFIEKQMFIITANPIMCLYPVTDLVITSAYVVSFCISIELSPANAR